MFSAAGSQPTLINPDCIRVLADDPMEEATMMRDWSDLPREILEQIISHLYGEDVRSFHSVCTSWDAVDDMFYYLKKEHHPLTSPEPQLKSQWLVQKKCLELTYRFVHPVYPDVVYAKNLVQGAEGRYARAIIRCSKDGWLLMSSTTNYFMFFLCPFTETVIDLPNLYWIYKLDAVTFTSTSRSSTDSGVVFIIAYDMPTHVAIATLCLGENTWKTRRYANNVPFKPSYSSNPVPYKDMFYCLSIDGKLGVYNLKKNKWTVLKKPQCLTPHKWQYESHLVSHKGGLMSVFLGKSGSWVSIFKFDVSNLVWKKVYNLGSYSLFLSLSTSFATNNVLPMMKNKIFFPLLHKNYPVYYCLETKTFQTYGTDLCAENLSSPEIGEKTDSCWIEPVECELYTYNEPGDEGTKDDETRKGKEHETSDERRRGRGRSNKQFEEHQSINQLEKRMVAERESIGTDSYSDSLDKRFIIVQTVQSTDGDDGPEEIWNTTGYYMLDLQTGDASTLPRTVQKQDEGKMSSMVALESQIFIFGKPLINSSSDDDDDDSTMNTMSISSYFLDMLPDSQSTKKWKRAHPLTMDHELPSGGAVAFAGKMYLFRNSDDDCFCEVFDPSEPEPQWRRIKSTPTPTPTPGAAENKIDPPVLADHKNKRIIVFLGNLSSLFAYYPFEDRWECLDECFFLQGYRRWLLYPEPVTIVDGVIYIHRPGLSRIFMAFDIATQKWLNVSVSSDDGVVQPNKVYLPIGFYVSLLHLGKDVLCLLASRYKDSIEAKTSTLVHVVQFKVKLINNDNNGTKEVIVTPLCNSSGSRYYHLPSRCALYHSIAL